MKSLLTALPLFFFLAAKSQPCNCLSEFYFIKNHIEQNHGGFNKKIKSPEEPVYKNFTVELARQISEMKDQRYCIAYLKKYILFLKDHHSNITGGTGQPVNEKDSAAVAAFLQSDAYTKTEILPADPVYITQYLKQSKDPIEGIYNTPDGSYKVAVLKNKTDGRDYAAIIMNAATPLWTKGQVKFELKTENDTLVHYFGYQRNHAMIYEPITKKGPALALPGWLKQTGNTGASAAVIDNDLIRFSILDSLTTLLSIRSFNSSQYKKLDSVYKQVIPVIRQYPHFIIDLRNNGGGADFAYSPLMPLLYTDTIYNDRVERFNSPGNVAAYKKFDSAAQAAGNRPVFRNVLGMMSKAAPYSFVAMDDGKPSTTVYKAVGGFPLKVAILYNKGCASSCESLLFDAMFSRKTIFTGENSGGYTGYGDVMNIQTPCGNTLSWTTTVYLDQWRYEFVGIPPHYRIPDTETDWVDYTRRLLEK